MGPGLLEALGQPPFSNHKRHQDIAGEQKDDCPPEQAEEKQNIFGSPGAYSHLWSCHPATSTPRKGCWIGKRLLKSFSLSPSKV